MKKFLIGVIAASLALAACGGGSSKDKTGSTGGSPTTSGGGSGGSAFSDLVAKAKNASFKVTYTTGGGSSQTIAQDGKGKTSYTSGDSMFITDGDKVIQCSGTGSSQTCTDVGAAGAGIAKAATSFLTTAYAGLAGLNSSLFNGHTSSETIAGRDATCVTLKASDFGGGLGGAISKLAGDPSVTQCVDKDTGVLLKYSATSDGKTNDVFVATAYSEPSDSDFEPPVTPETTPSLPGGITIPSLPGGITIPSVPAG